MSLPGPTFEEWCKTNNPALLKQWNVSKNGCELPSNLKFKSNVPVWWVCEKNHEWKAAPSQRVAGRGCPYCSHRRLISGETDLESLNPQLASEWHPIKNGDFKPSEVSSKNDKKVWWLGKCGHEWEARINDRARGRGCPYCAGKRLLVGFNDVASQHPNLKEEWDYSKNEKDATDYVCGSKDRVWWKCKKGHEWQATIKDRVHGTGCPYCAGRKVLIGFNDMATTAPDKAVYWHPDKNLPLTPQLITQNSNTKYWWKCPDCGYEWKTTASSMGSSCPKCTSESRASFGEKAVAFYLSQITDVIENYKTPDLGRGELDIYLPHVSMAVEYDGRFWHKNKTSDEIKNEKCKKIGIELIRIREKGCPEIKGCICYNVEHNNNDSLSAAINEIVKKVCSKLSIEVCISADVVHDTSLILAKKYLSRKKGSLAMNYPELTKELHPTKNGTLNPETIPSHSNKKIWWLGKCGHEWCATIASRVRGNGCPYCINRYVLVGNNDLLTTNPEVAAEWHPTKNSDLKPTDITKGYHKKVWWLGKCGHECEAEVYSITCHNSRGCPYCSSNKDLPGYNDLKSKYPDVADEWHPAKNGSLKPNEILPKSNKKYWWLGKCGHEWDASASDRVSGSGCPFCSGKRVLVGFNDLESQYPDISAEWHPLRNQPLTANNVTSKSSKRVWWLGKCGHEWQSAVHDRTDRGNGCPYCGNKRILVGFNDLQSKYPEVAKDWDYELNPEKPSEILYGSQKIRYWVCSKCGYRWKSSVWYRTSEGYGCNNCNRMNLKKR